MGDSKRTQRDEFMTICMFLVAAIVLLTSTALPAWAQYVPIPNFTGTHAGQQFRNAINNKLNGSDTIAPQLVHLNFANLPSTVTNGQMFYVNDGKAGTPCVGGGAGVWAIGINGAWVCLANGSGGGSSVATGMVYPETFNAVDDARVFYAGAMANGSSTLIDTTDAPFTNTSVGKIICVGGISGVYGPSNFTAFGPVPQSEECGTITSYTSASQVGLSFSNSNGGNVTNTEFRFGTDNTAALQNTLNSCAVNGCTIVLSGPYAVSGTLTVPSTAAINLQGIASYAPDENLTNSHTVIGTASGIWWLTTSITASGSTFGALVYGGNTSNGALVQNTFYSLSNLQLVAGAGGGPCTTGVSHCNIGYFGTLAGGSAASGTGPDGVVINGMQHVAFSGVSISNFRGDCIHMQGGNIEFLKFDNSFALYCGNNGIEIGGSSWSNQDLILDSDIESNGANGVYLHPATGNAEYGDTFNVISNTIQWNAVTGSGSNLNIAGGRDHVVIGNWFEADGGGSAVDCANSGGNNSSGAGSQLWIGNHYDFNTVDCDNIQFNTNHGTIGGLPTCTANFVGSENWVTDGAGTPASPACTYAGTYTVGAGTATCKVGCTQTGSSTYGWRYGY